MADIDQKLNIESLQNSDKFPSGSGGVANSEDDFFLGHRRIVRIMIQFSRRMRCFLKKNCPLMLVSVLFLICLNFYLFFYPYLQWP